MTISRGWALLVFVAGCAATTVGPPLDSGVRDGVAAMDTAPARDVASVMDAPESSAAVDAPDIAVPPDLGLADVIDAMVDIGGDTGCADGMTACDGVCVNISSDNNNCGLCGTACAPGNTCNGGSCACGCGMGMTNCSGAGGCLCANIQTDNHNCGSCGTVCPPGTVCSTGICVTPCIVGLTDCLGTCINEQIDRNNCGACGNACCPGAVCFEGSCDLGCGIGENPCGTSCVDLRCANEQSDNNNCGMCGNVCPSGTVCSSATCVMVTVDAGRADAAGTDGSVPPG